MKSVKIEVKICPNLINGQIFQDAKTVLDKTLSKKECYLLHASTHDLFICIDYKINSLTSLNG